MADMVATPRDLAAADARTGAGTGIAGVDFGTTNSVVVLLQPDGGTRTMRFRMPDAGMDSDVFRSVLCFWTEEGPGRSALRHAAGPAAVEAFLEEPLDSRLIMSMKTYLAQPSFRETRVFGRVFTLEDLVALFLGALAEAAGLEPGAVRVVAGRPVRFAGERADDTLGEARLRAAFARAGFAATDTALEPEAAGYRFARALSGAATVLIGDFGGGTSDFSVLRFDPEARDGAAVRALGNAGIGIAGDSFDARIIDHVIAPRLGKDDSYTVMGKSMPIPAEFYAAFARWHRLSMMRTPRTLREIAEVARTASHPERLHDLIRVVEDGLGYALYRTVSTVKAELSRADRAVLRFAHGALSIERAIERAEFERWIAPDIARLDATVGQALDAAGIGAAEVDRVFLTGGTSFVPAVRAIFARRFGAAKLAGGGEFVSVAEGLALIGRDRGRATPE